MGMQIAPPGGNIGMKVGDTVDVAGDGPKEPLKVVGLAKFGGVSSVGGFVLVVTSLQQAQKIAGQPDAYNQILVAANPGVSPTQLRDQLRQVQAPVAVNVRTGQQQASKNVDDIHQALGFLTTALLVFAGIALFVGAFIIFNTFSITVAQRMREFALLRTLGASRGQVMRSVLFEGLLIGLLGSILGLLLGLVLAPGLRALFKSFGADLPSQGTVVETRTIIVSLVVGTVGCVALAVQRRTAPPAHVASEHGPDPLPWARLLPIGVVAICMGTLFGALEVATVAVASLCAAEVVMPPVAAVSSRASNHE